MPTANEAANDPTSNESATGLAEKLLAVQDRLYDLRAEIEFYHEAITAFVENADCQILDTRSQRHGLALTGRRISEAAQALSETLGAIREEIRAKGNMQ